MTIALRPEWSLTRRQLFAVGGPLTLLAAVLGIGGSWFIAGVSERMSDRLLAGSIKSLVETMGVKDGEVTLEIPASAFGMLEDNARDSVYYVVRQGNRTLTGYESFPRESVTKPALDEIVFRYDEFLGKRIRVARTMRQLPRLRQPVTVEVAETLGERDVLAWRMLLGLVLLELTLVAFAVLLIWPAVQWSLRPILSLKRQMQGRSSDQIDFTPLPLGGVPPELVSLVAEFNTILSRLEHSVQGMRRFTGDAAHQMRTPLAVLKTHVAVLKQQALNIDSIEDIEQAADRLQRLLTQLLTLARVEDAAPAQPQTRADARLAAQQVCIRLAPVGLLKQISLELDADRSFDIELEPLLLEELLTNLIDNAIRYNRAGGIVRVSVTTADGSGELSIADDGPGIPNDAQTKVFDRFYRLERDQVTAGSGLGLSIAQVLAKLGGGEIRLAEGLFGRGLSVRLIFPLADSRE